MKKSRRKVLAMILTICMLVLVCSIPASAFVDPQPSTTHGVYLTGLTSTSVIVNWFMDMNSDGEVQYGTSSTNLDQVVEDSVYGMGEVSTRHSVQITGLTPGTKYYYRIHGEYAYLDDSGAYIGDNPYTGTTRNFTTLDTNDTDINFYFLADVQDNVTNLNTMLDLIGTLSSSYANCDFVVYGGDQMVNPESQAQIFSSLIDPSSTKFAGYHPFVYIRGNGDYRGEYARNLKDYVPNPSGKFYYGFNHGKAAFAVLDTGVGSADTAPAYNGTVVCQAYRTEEYNWLQSYVSTSEWTGSPFKIALMHDPSYGYGDDGNTSEWKTLMSSAGTQLVLAGHNLKYSHYYPGDNGENYHKVVLNQNQVAKVNVTSTLITVTVYNSAGAKIDYFTIPTTLTNYTNLAVGKTATSSTLYSGSSPSNGNDADIITKWQPSSNAVNQWYKVDLGASYDLTGSAVLWPQNGKLYKYKIEVSANNSTWTTVVNKTTTNPSTEMYQTDSFTANARYVRITVTGLDTGTWATINEFKVFGN